MLITARAERGPQWDMGTQQFVFSILFCFCTHPRRFLVDEYSDLYYDSTPLFEAVKKQAELENAEEQKQHQQAQQQHEQAKQAHLERAREREREHQLQLQNVQQMAMLDHPPSPQQRQYSSAPYPGYAGSPGMPPNMGNMRGGPYAGGGAPFTPSNGPQPGYYNNSPMGGHGPPQSPAGMMRGMDSPMRMGMGMGGGGMMGMPPGPDLSHMGMQQGMMTRGGGGMPGGMMAPPNPARRVTRGSSMYDDASYNPSLG